MPVWYTFSGRVNSESEHPWMEKEWMNSSPVAAMLPFCFTETMTIDISSLLRIPLA